MLAGSRIPRLIAVVIKSVLVLFPCCLRSQHSSLGDVTIGSALLPTGLPEDLTPLHVRQRSLDAIFAAGDSVEGREAAEAGVCQKLAKRCGYKLEVHTRIDSVQL